MYVNFFITLGNVPLQFNYLKTTVFVYIIYLVLLKKYELMQLYIFSFVKKKYDFVLSNF